MAKEKVHIPFSMKMVISTVVMVCALTVAGASLSLAENDQFRVRIALDAGSADAREVVVRQEADRQFEEHLHVNIYARMKLMAVHQIRLNLEFDSSHVEGARAFTQERVEYVFSGGAEPDWSRARTDTLTDGKLTIAYSLERAPRKLFVRCREEGHSFMNAYEVKVTRLQGLDGARSGNPLFADADFELSDAINNVIPGMEGEYDIICTPGDAQSVEVRLFPAEPTRIFALSRAMGNRPLGPETQVTWTLYRDGADKPMARGYNEVVGAQGLRLRFPRTAGRAKYRLQMEADSDDSTYGGAKRFMGTLELTLLDAGSSVYDLDFKDAVRQESGNSRAKMENGSDRMAVEIVPVGAPLRDGRRAAPANLPGTFSLRSGDEAVLRVRRNPGDATGLLYIVEMAPDAAQKNGIVIAAYEEGGVVIERSLSIELPDR